MKDLSIHDDRDKWKAEAQRRQEEVKCLLERIIREQELTAQFRARMLEAERLLKECATS